MTDLRPLAELPPDALDRLAERVFGAGDRPAGWLARKLAREAIDPALSVLAVRSGAPDPAPEDSLLGYLLVGREPGDPVAHSAGVGLIPEARGRGLGGRLLAHAADRLRRAGLAALRVLAEPAREPWYAREGLVVRARRVTLLAFGTCPISPVPTRKLPWSPDPAAGGVELCGWRAGIWERTPSTLAESLELAPGAWAHVSREGVARLVHRLVGPPERDPAALVEALLARIPRGTPVLLYGADAVSSVTARLRERGLTDVQRFAEMDLRLETALDNPRNGDA